MGKSNIFLTLLAGAVSFGLIGTSVGADESELIFVPPVRVIAKSKLGVVIRGEMKSVSGDVVLIVPDRSKFRNPNGVEYKLEKLQTLNIPDVDIKWTNGEDAHQFLVELSKQEGVPILNLAEFRQAELMKTELDPSPDVAGTAEPGKKIIMKPAKMGSDQTDSSKPVVTIVCGNCFKEVALKSDAGQKCPHCGILWDSSPLDEASLATKTQVPNMQAANTLGSGGGDAVMRPAAPVNLGANVAMRQGRPPAVAPQQIAQGGQPVAVPQPVQFQTQSQELTLENLPLWLKVGIFCACMGILYYTVFVR